MPLHPMPFARTGAIAFLLLLATELCAQTTVVVPCTLDNTLYESATGSLSNGRGMGLFVGVSGQPVVRRTLVRFDVAALVPAGARILNARLDLNVSRTAVAVPVPVAAHRVLRAWGEGTSNAVAQEGTGAPATTGDATWLHAIYPNTFWTTPGGDFDPTPSCTISTPTFGPIASPVARGLVDDVQRWLDNPAQNHGWLLKTDELTPYITRRFDSRESTTGPGPSLSVAYLLPGQTAVWGTGCPVGAQPFGFSFAGAAIGGTSVQMVQSNGPAGSFAVNLFALDLDLVGAPLLPQCSLHLPFGGVIVTHGIVPLDGAGAASNPFAVPAGYPGVMLVSQSAALDNSAAGFVLSNAAVMLLQ